MSQTLKHQLKRSAADPFWEHLKICQSIGQLEPEGINDRRPGSQLKACFQRVFFQHRRVCSPIETSQQNKLEVFNTILVKALLAAG